MLLNEDIVRCLGEPAARYAANKHRGGTSGQKGTRYEDFFMAFKVIESAADYISNPETEDMHVQGQCDEFVDDLRLKSSTKTDYFQLKNQSNVNWSSGEHSLEDDFKNQYILSEYRKEFCPTTNLVVSSESLATDLGIEIPSSIESHTGVIFFPWTETANRLVLELATLREKLAGLCSVESPSNDILCGVFCGIMSTCNDSLQGFYMTEIIEEAGVRFSGLIRLLPVSERWENRLLPDFKEILDRIAGLSYGAKMGYFYWEGFGTSGTFQHSVVSDQFAEFQQAVIESPPATFEEFEKALP